jgi:hypothetical protein
MYANVAMKYFVQLICISNYNFKRQKTLESSTYYIGNNTSHDSSYLPSLIPLGKMIHYFFKKIRPLTISNNIMQNS